MDEDMRELRTAIVESIHDADATLMVLYGYKDYHEKVVIASCKEKGSTWTAPAFRQLMKINDEIRELNDFKKQANEDIAIIDKELND